MSQKNYKQIEEALSRKEPFVGNSCEASIRKYLGGTGRLYDDRELKDWLGKREGSELYIVYSYATPIFVLDKATDEYWLNPDKYSATTSRLQNILKRVFVEQKGKQCLI